MKLPEEEARASLVAQMVKNLPAMQETQVRSLSWEDPLEKGMATHSSLLAWRIPWTEEPGGLRSMGSQSPDMTERICTLQLINLLCLPCGTCINHPPQALGICSRD